MNQSANKSRTKENKQLSLDSFFKRDNEIPIEKIIISKESRRPVKQSRVISLAESIQERGLMNPILISKSNHLIAGYHRVEAFKYLGKRTIPCTFTNVIDPVELKLMEIDENENRSELTY